MTVQQPFLLLLYDWDFSLDILQYRALQFAFHSNIHTDTNTHTADSELACLPKPLELGVKPPILGLVKN